MKIKICAQCGNTFECDSPYSRKYCSLSCQRRATINASNSKHKEKLSVYNHKGKIAPLLIERYGHKCAICGWQAFKESFAVIDGTAYKANGNEIHHIVPVRAGGLSEWDNLILLCPNHHKLANMGLISAEELSEHVLPPYTETEREHLRLAAISNAANRISHAIFGTSEEKEDAENAN